MTPAPLQSSTPLPRIRALRAFCMSTHFNFHYWTKQITGWAGASGASWILLQAVQETFKSAAANQQQCCIHFIASVSSTLQIIPEANITKTRFPPSYTPRAPGHLPVPCCQPPLPSVCPTVPPAAATSQPRLPSLNEPFGSPQAVWLVLLMGAEVASLRERGL